MTARATIDLGAIRRNVERIAACAPHSIACAVVKADGYGHGAREVANAALAGGAGWLAVATPREAAELRSSDLDPAVPVLLLSEPDPAGLAEAWAERPAALRFTVASLAGIEVLESLAVRDDQLVSVHLKVDTGMHRAGVAPAGALGLAERIRASSVLELEGLWTHFAVADDLDDGYTATQIRTFDETRGLLAASGHAPPVQHLCNSAGTLGHSAAHRDLIRAGIAMYGVAPSPAMAGLIDLEAALRLTATITGIRSIEAGEGVSYGRRFRASQATRVATLDIGYADGLRRDAAQSGVEVLVRGQRVPIIGAVTMDQTMLAVGDDSDLGDEVVLIGVCGDQEITAEEVAEARNTIGYEVLTSLGPRVRRTYVTSAAPTDSSSE